MTLVDNLRRLARHEHADHSIADEAADRLEELESALRELVTALDANDEDGTHGGRYGGAADHARAIRGGPGERADIDYTWHSTPQLWIAMRKGACGCPECKPPFGMGKTKEEAEAQLLEWEEDYPPQLIERTAMHKKMYSCPKEKGDQKGGRAFSDAAFAKGEALPSAVVTCKPHSTYMPLTEDQINTVRARHKGGMVYDDDDVDTICDMAVNSLLYAEEIHRLRSIPSATDAAGKLRAVAAEIEGRFPADARQLRDLADAL